MALLTQFLTGIRGFILEQNGTSLSHWLKVEPNPPQMYHQLIQELRTGFPATSNALSDLVEKCLPEEDDVPEGRGSPWPGFHTFMKEYLQYLRDVDFNDYLKMHKELSLLLSSCATALGNPSNGSVMYETSISMSSSLSNLAIYLHRNPELTRNKTNRIIRGEKSIVEKTADVIQKNFTICLTDRSSDRFNKPKGKKQGVYIFANLVLKLLFKCRRTRLATQMLTNIDASGPALSYYPKSQQVTYLYYLGRFWWENEHYSRARGCLQRAYHLTPTRFVSHRRLILTYLIPSSMNLGLLPTPALLDRPEAALCPLREIYTYLNHAVRKGDWLLFDNTLRAHKPYMFNMLIYINQRSRLRPLLWRSLIRRIFMITYTPPPPTLDVKRTPAPTLDFRDVLVICTFIQHRLEGYLLASELPAKRPPHTNAIFMKAVTNTESAATTLVPPPGGPKELLMEEGLLGGNMEHDLKDVASRVAGLITQGFMNGFISHSQQKFAVMGLTKAGGSAVKAGFPEFWATLKYRWEVEEKRDLSVIPAWVQIPKTGG